ncbi:hypothetical protein KKB83_00735 [Patescibacteria group bacterium]|nr:hypothetical protein [Patescibacteria group bacterium]
MTQLQGVDKITIKDQVQVFYNPQGKPSSVILPYNLFSRLLPKKKSMDSILKESSRIAIQENIKLQDLLDELERVREKKYRDCYAL